MRVVLFFVVLAGIALGAAYGYYRHLIKKGEIDSTASFWDFLTGKAQRRIKILVRERVREPRPPQRSGDEGEKQPFLSRETQGSQVTKSTTKTTTEESTVVPKPKQVDESLVGQLEHKVRSLYKAAKFLDAQFAAKDLMDVFERAGARDDTRYLWAVRMFKRCRAFAILVSRIKRSPLATEEEIYRIKSLKSGNVFFARIIREYERDGEEFVDFERDAGITWRGVLKENLEITPATREQFKEWLKGRLAEKERFISKRSDPAAVYIYLVTYAWRYGLDERVPELLEEAFSQTGSEVVLDYVLADRDDVDQIKIDLLEGMGREADAAKLRAVAAVNPVSSSEGSQPKQHPDESVQHHETEPDRQPTGKEESLTSEQPTPKETSSKEDTAAPIGLSGDAFQQYKEACRLRDQAVPLIGKAINLMAGKKRSALGKEAQSLLRRAIKIAISLLRQYPDNKAVAALQRELQGHIQFVNKMLVTLR